ncbi:hypothetical protein SASK131_10760 [Staphylococcus argenteus]|nr:hypothetical protein SA19056_10670 [Staphylococcus argenteus]GJF41855.1 hypothetical protein SA19059_15070 [Staphylococcus argenteus]GJF46916.1 hypothetical protein SA19080_14320 [Staphylococcus argenteus]GJF61992.1 hypothetical protein SA19109_09790 [Staphylococcus argenteus]GJF67713.1 hypothetical protein SA19136_14610 [Staphylococcus argenteus]
MTISKVKPKTNGVVAVKVPKIIQIANAILHMITVLIFDLADPLNT